MAITPSEAAAQLRSIADQLEAEPAAADSSTATATQEPATAETVTVQDGQTLQDIADKLDTDLAALHAYNAAILGSNPAAPVAAGTVLTVPPASTAADAQPAAAADAAPAAEAGAAAPEVHSGDAAFTPTSEGAPTDGQA